MLEAFEEAYLGIFAYDKEVIKYLNNDVTFNEGIYVVKIAKRRTSCKTNLKTGDVITKIDGNSINRMSELRTYIYRKKPGEKVTLTISRNNKRTSNRSNVKQKVDKIRHNVL